MSLIPPSGNNNPKEPPLPISSGAPNAPPTDDLLQISNHFPTVDTKSAARIKTPNRSVFQKIIRGFYDTLTNFTFGSSNCDGKASLARMEVAAKGYDKEGAFYISLANEASSISPRIKLQCKGNNEWFFISVSLGNLLKLGFTLLGKSNQEKSDILAKFAEQQVRRVVVFSKAINSREYLYKGEGFLKAAGTFKYNEDTEQAGISEIKVSIRDLEKKIAKQKTEVETKESDYDLWSDEATLNTKKSLLERCKLPLA